MNSNNPTLSIILYNHRYCHKFTRLALTNLKLFTDPSIFVSVHIHNFISETYNPFKSVEISDTESFNC